MFLQTQFTANAVHFHPLNFIVLRFRNYCLAGHQNSVVACSTPENTLNKTITPLSNITNIVDINSKRNRCKYLGMYENNLRDTARNLFAETSSRLDEYSAESSSQTEDTAKCMPDDDNGMNYIL